MSPLVTKLHCLGLSLTTLLAGLAGCASTAPQTSTTTVTSATVDSSGIPASRELDDPAMPAGSLVCRAKTTFEGNVELYLEWKNGTAKGILRRVAPSGDVHVQRVTAEHYKGAIIADDVASTDLVVHAAMVQAHHNKPHIRLGDWRQPWAPCE